MSVFLPLCLSYLPTCDPDSEISRGKKKISLRQTFFPQESKIKVENPLEPV